MNQRERLAAAELPLEDYFERIHAPVFLSAARPGTLKRNRETISHWRRLTRNPGLRYIDAETLAVFKSRMLNPAAFDRPAGRRTPQLTMFADPPPPPAAEHARPLSRATVNLHLRQVMSILNKAGPPGPKNRDALGILESAPWTRPLRQYKRRPRNVKDDLLEAVYRACSVARLPAIDGVRAEHWWKALVVAALVVGYRKGGLLSIQWTAVDWDESLVRLEAEGDKCWTEREKPVPRIVLQHLLRIRSAHELIFHWPHSEATFYRQWRAIQQAAGIPPEGRIKIHDLKRACGTRYAAMKASPWCVQMMLDHSAIQTASAYINAEDEAREAVERFPLPAAFGEDFSSAGLAIG